MITEDLNQISAKIENLLGKVELPYDDVVRLLEALRLINEVRRGHDSEPMRRGIEA